jgi:hypothetical protein
MAGCEKKHLFLVPFTFFNEYDELNKYGFLNINNLSSVQQKHSKSQTFVHCCLQINYLENNRGLTCSSALNVENMS